MTIECSGRLCHECRGMMEKVDLKFDNISNKLDESVIHETPVPPVEPVLSRREEQIRK